MLRISKLTDYGTVVLAHLAATPDHLHTASHLAGVTRIALPTVSKLLKSFHRAGLVESARGTHGGYRLARPAAQISAAQIIDAIDGPVAITECSGQHSACDIAEDCRTGSAWQRINGAIRGSLAGISLAQLCGQEVFASWRPALGAHVRSGSVTRAPMRG